MSRISFCAAAICLFAVLFPATCLAQSDLPRFGVGVKASTLGIGVEAATALSKRNNVRFGFNTFSYDHDFDKDGIDYSATLKLRSAQVLLDQYIVGGFHVSPGFLFYNRNRGLADASVRSGQSFSLGDRSYISDGSNPVRGTGTLELGKASPMLMIGFGNLLPRSGRHFTANFEMGVVFQGSPDAKLNLTGRACDTVTAVCGEVMSIPGLPANIQEEQAKINDSLKAFKYYPVISLGFGYSF